MGDVCYHSVLSSHILSKYLIKVVQNCNRQVHFIVMKLCLTVREKTGFKVLENEVLLVEKLMYRSIALCFVFFA